jgi:hypothetical protein
VVDLHFLNLYFSEAGYHSGTGFNLNTRTAASSHYEFYKNEREAEANFLDTIAKPPTLDRFLKAARWFDNTFPSSTGRKFIISTCSYGPEASDDALAMTSLL